MASVLRIAYAGLLIPYVVIWMLDGQRWFSDQGVLSAESAQRLSTVPYWSIFFIFDSTEFVQLGLAILLLQVCLLLLGCWSRFQCACIFMWLVSFQHRNPLICDGEDSVFRLFAFLFVFLPLDHAWSLTARFRNRPPVEAGPSRAWGLRLIQVEMAAIYFSAGLSKMQGATWRDGTAMYYVSRMDDHFGRIGLPTSILDMQWLMHTTTWTALAIELALPFALWFSPTRRAAIIVGIGFHLSIECLMNLFLFEWIMIVGLLSFIQPKEWGFKGA